MSSLAHTGIGHLLWQLPGPAAGLCHGERWHWWGRMPCPTPCAPPWAKPASHTARASFKGDLPWLPKSRCGNSISYRLCRILSGNFGLQIEVKRRPMGHAGLPLACAELQLAPLRHTWASWEVWRWQAEELKGLLYPQGFPFSLGCPLLLPPDTSREGVTLQVRSNPVPVVYSAELTPWLDQPSCGAGWALGSAVPHSSGCHTPSQGSSAHSFWELLWSMIMQLASSQLQQSARAGLQTS